MSIGTLQPIGVGVDDWTFITLDGEDSPGTIPKGGIKGFRRETGWDKQAGKGTKGATLILKSQPPAEGTITFQLFCRPGETTSQDFTDYDSFASKVLSIDPVKQKAEGLSIFYPGFAGIKLTRVVVGWYTGPEHQGKGLYHVTVQLIEWQQPPPVSIVSKVSKTAPALPATPVPDALTALQNAFAATLGPNGSVNAARIAGANQPGGSR